MEPGNIFSGIPKTIPEEIIENIIDSESIKIKRIISKGQASPPGYWYDQDSSEWVLVLEGRARLTFENENESMVMEKGDYVNIPAHRRHRVEWTDPDEKTVWLAIHY